MQTPEITAYLKTYCGWSAGVRAVLAKYNLPYTEKDIIQNPAFRWEMETKSGQPLSPCVEINGQMLADVSGDEIETYLNEIFRPRPKEQTLPLRLEIHTRWVGRGGRSRCFSFLRRLGHNLRHEEGRRDAGAQ